MAFARYVAEQESARRAGLPEDAPWFPPPAPALLDLPGALQRLWNEVQATLKAQATQREFDTWIRRAVLRDVAGGVATIVVPNAMVKDAIERRFLGQLRDLLTMHVGEPIEVGVILNSSAPAYSAVSPQPPASESPSSIAQHPELKTQNSELKTQNSELKTEPPSWIGAERWDSLPAMLRAALIGSTLASGEIQAVSPHLDRLLRTRYAREVDELKAGAGAGSE